MPQAAPSSGRGNEVLQTSLKRVASSVRRRGLELLSRTVRKQLAHQVRGLSSTNFCLVSNNCVAGILYEDAGLQKESPTAGLYFSGRAYAQFLEDLGTGQIRRWADVAEADLIYKESQHCWALPVPAGEVVFLHYPSRADAVAKWKRRLDRMAPRSPIVIACSQNAMTVASLAEPLEQFRYSFAVDGSPAPPADEAMLNRGFLRRLNEFFDAVLAELPRAERSLHVHYVCDSRGFIERDFHPHR